MKNNQEKKKSTLLKDAMVLVVITLVAGLSLGFIYELTKGPIEKRQMEIKLAAYEMVYTGADSIEIDETLMDKAEGFANIDIDEVNRVYDKEENHSGYITVVTSKEGYDGDITIAFGYGLDGEVHGMEVLSMTETPDVGTKINEETFKSQFRGKKTKGFIVTKTGATGDNEIDGIGGATISTDAAVQAINEGISFLNEYGDMIGGSNE